MTAAEERELDREEHRNGEEKFFSFLVNCVGENRGTMDAGATTMITNEERDSDDPALFNGVVGEEETIEHTATEKDDVNQNNMRL